jgi:CubicO group peptidase (beta-lactamase class C family)
MRLANHFRSAARAKIAVALLAVFSWLVSVVESDDQRALPASRDAKAEAAWQRHGFTGAQRNAIHAALQRGIDQKFVPGGALLIIHRGEPILREGFGVASLETAKRFTIDAPCRIASVTKPHTSTLIAMLVEQGKLSWENPVDKYLPSFAGIAVPDKGPAARTPKVRELLSHTAGFPGQRAIDSGRWKFTRSDTLAGAVANLSAQGFGGAFLAILVCFAILVCLAPTVQ